MHTFTFSVSILLHLAYAYFYIYRGVFLICTRKKCYSFRCIICFAFHILNKIPRTLMLYNIIFARYFFSCEFRVTLIVVPLYFLYFLFVLLLFVPLPTPQFTRVIAFLTITISYFYLRVNG